MSGNMLRTGRAAMALAGGLLLAACGHVGTAPTQTSALQDLFSGGDGKIALLVPYGDESKKDLIALATSLENSARLAIRDLEAEGLELQIYETNGSVEGAGAAAQAALDNGASVILGPVFKDAAIHTAAIARNKGVPVLSFSNDVTIVGGNLFVLGHTFDDSADRIIQFASANGRRQILSVHARNPQGIAGKVAVESAALAHGSEIRSSISYEFSQMGVVDSIPRIVEAVKLTDPDIIVFTADTAGALSLLGQLLPEAGIDTEQVKFAGLTRWDIPESNLGNKGLQGGWFPLPDTNLTASFSYRYQYEYGEAPHPLAGLAYDGIIAAHGMLGGGSSRANAALVNPRGFIGATGPFRFQSNGRIERSLAVAEVRNNRAEIISAAPRSFFRPES